MALKVAINGFGRIGRCFARAAAQDADIEIVAINDLGSAESLAYLLKYDTVYRAAPFAIAIESDKLKFGLHEAKLLQVKDPATLAA